MEQFLCVCWAGGDRKKKERIMCPLMRWSTLFFDRSASQFSEQSVNSSEFFHFFLRWQIVFNADWIIKKIRYLFLIKSLIFLYNTPSFSLCMQVTRWWWWWWWWQRQKRFSWRVNWQKKNGGRGLKHKTIRVASSWCAVIRKVGRKRNNGRKKKKMQFVIFFFPLVLLQQNIAVHFLLNTSVFFKCLLVAKMFQFFSFVGIFLQSAVTIETGDSEGRNRFGGKLSGCNGQDKPSRLHKQCH